jgi:hypothetical protein
MTEIHTGTSQSIFLDLFNETADETPTAYCKRPDGTTVEFTVSSPTPPTGVTQRFEATIGMAHTQTQGVLEVIWDLSIDSFEFEKIDYLEVVTPYLSLSEVKKIYTDATDEQAAEVEASVRHIIEAHTGQTFGFSKDETVSVEGHGESALRLPKRLVELKGVSTLTAILNPLAAAITSDGWYLKKGWSYEVTPVVSDSLYWTGDDYDTNAAPGEPGYEKPSHGPITVAPGAGGRGTPWRDDYPFEITGDWGYKTVPAPVKEAAKLLVNDYACSEAMYRDRYLDSIKAADWRLEFSSRAWESTGNVRADQLLSEYVILDWAVI